MFLGLQDKLLDVELLGVCVYTFWIAADGRSMPVCWAYFPAWSVTRSSLPPQISTRWFSFAFLLLEVQLSVVLDTILQNITQQKADPGSRSLSLLCLMLHAGSPF